MENYKIEEQNSRDADKIVMITFTNPRKSARFCVTMGDPLDYNHLVVRSRAWGSINNTNFTIFPKNKFMSYEEGLLWCHTAYDHLSTLSLKKINQYEFYEVVDFHEGGGVKIPNLYKGE